MCEGVKVENPIGDIPLKSPRMDKMFSTSKYSFMTNRGWFKIYFFLWMNIRVIKRKCGGGLIKRNI
jgi:hypothetical protein